MPALPNSRHELFAQALAQGRSQLEAHGDAGFKAHRGNASKLAQDKSILERVAEIVEQRATIERKATEKAAEALSIDKQWIMGKLKENAERALQAVPVNGPDGATGEYKYEGSVANRALELLGKELGMFIDRKEVKRVDDFDRLSDEELARIATSGAGSEEAAGTESRPPLAH